MGNRGSKSDSHISVKEQRVDGSSVFFKNCKVYSKCQGNLVFIHNMIGVNTIVEFKKKMYLNNIYSNFLSRASPPHLRSGRDRRTIFLFSSKARRAKHPPVVAAHNSSTNIPFVLARRLKGS
jgi:hypothetical protein